MKRLDAFDAKHDPLCLVGKRWLVRGGCCLWAGSSGLGKSSLVLQLAMYWATGTTIFGLRPVHPLRSLIIQAENDEGDIAEQWQGIKAGITDFGDMDIGQAQSFFEKNVIIYHLVGKTGPAFLEFLNETLEKTQADLCWIDPFFGYAGCDLLDPEKTGRFLRDGFIPIMKKRRCNGNMMHHAGKPKQTNGQTPDQLDLQYLGYGTSEIQNSFRAVNILRKLPTPPNCYQLDFAKRGDRCGARDLDGHSTQTIFLEHSSGGIFWLQRGAPTGPKSKYTHDQILCHMDAEKPIKVSELLKLAVHPDHAHMSRATFFRLWDEIILEKKAVESGPEGWVLPPPKSHWSHEVS